MARLDVLQNNEIGGKVLRHLLSADRSCDGVIPDATRELVRTRVSQINGCGFCLDMHTKDAVRAGESAVRLHLVATWRESTVFDEAERAALRLAEEATRIADGGEVSDETWAAAADHYDERQLTALLWTIAGINAFNIINVSSRQVGGGYTPGMFG